MSAFRQLKAWLTLIVWVVIPVGLVLWWLCVAVSLALSGYVVARVRSVVRSGAVVASATSVDEAADDRRVRSDASPEQVAESNNARILTERTIR